MTKVFRCWPLHLFKSHVLKLINSTMQYYLRSRLLKLRSCIDQQCSFVLWHWCPILPFSKSPNLQMGWDEHGFKSLHHFFCVLLKMTVHVSMGLWLKWVQLYRGVPLHLCAVSLTQCNASNMNGPFSFIADFWYFDNGSQSNVAFKWNVHIFKWLSTGTDYTEF